MWFCCKSDIKRKSLLLLAVVLLCAILGLIIWKANNLDWMKEQVQAVLKKETFSTLQSNSMDVSWAGLSLRVTLHEVRVIDQSTKIPFFSANTMQADVSVLTWIFSRRVAINKIILDHAALTLGLNLDKNTIEILGLKGESLPQSIDMQQALAALSDLDKIELNHVDVFWKTPLGNSAQQISGTLAWQNKALQSWQFKGTHALQLGKDLPNVSQNIALQATGLYQKIKWSLSGSPKGASFSGHWHISPNEPLNWDLSLKNMSLSPLHAVLGALNKSTVSKKIPEWLIWLDNSIKKGIISHLYWDNSDNPSGEIHFEETDLQYDPDWPALTNIEGKWLFANGAWGLEAAEAYIQGIPVTTLSAAGKIKNDAVYVVTVDGKVDSTLDKGVAFLRECPLKKTAGEGLYQNHLMGDMRLALHLDIPISMSTKNKNQASVSLPIAVKGSILVDNMSLHNNDWDVSLSHGHGKISFTETGVESVVDSVSLKVPAAWPVDWPSEGPLRFALSWDDTDNLFFAGRFADAWDAKTTWRDGALINGEVLLNLKGKERSHWPVSPQDKTILIVSKSFEARVQTDNWASFKKTGPIELNLTFFKCDLNAALNNASSELSSVEVSKVKALPALFKQAIHLKSQSTWIRSYFVGKIDIQANPEAEGWRITNLSAERPNFRLNATGLWSIQDDKSTLSGTIESPHIGNLLNDWEAGGTNLKEGRMETDFSIQWPGGPANFAKENLFGEANVNIRNGRLLGVDVGLGRLLGLLSVDNLKRRLQLDFRDVFKKGFVFDKAEAKLGLEGETWFLKWANVKAPIADLVLKGSTNMKTQALSLFIKAVPKSASSGVPVAAAIAGGPALGAGLWVFDKVFMGTQNRKSAGIFYEVTGTWDKPVVSKVSSLDMVEP
jgi:uncharacterized protein YhdP